MNCIYTWIILNYGVRVLYGFLELLVAEKLNDSELEDYDYLNSKIQNWYEMELINSNQLYYFNQIIIELKGNHNQYDKRLNVYTNTLLLLIKEMNIK